MKDLKFKHLPIYQTFVKGCGLFTKVSKTQAISVLFSEKHKFKSDDPVSLIRTINYSSPNQGSMKSSYDNEKLKFAALKLIKEYEHKKGS